MLQTKPAGQGTRTVATLVPKQRIRLPRSRDTEAGSFRKNGTQPPTHNIIILACNHYTKSDHLHPPSLRATYKLARISQPSWIAAEFRLYSFICQLPGPRHDFINKLIALAVRNRISSIACLIRYRVSSFDTHNTINICLCALLSRPSSNSPTFLSQVE